MTEDQIERRVEKSIDRLDKAFMSDHNVMTQEEYDQEVRFIDNWAQVQYKALRTGNDFREDFRNYS